MTNWQFEQHKKKVEEKRRNRRPAITVAPKTQKKPRRGGRPTYEPPRVERKRKTYPPAGLRTAPVTKKVKKAIADYQASQQR